MKKFFSVEDVECIFIVKSILDECTKDERASLYSTFIKNKNCYGDIKHEHRIYHGIFTLYAIEILGFNEWRKSCLKISSETYILFHYKYDIFGVPKWKLFQLKHTNPTKISKSINDPNNTIGERINNTIKAIFD